MNGYVKLSAHLAKGGNELWLPCADDFIPLSIHMTTCELFQFADGDRLYGVQLEDHVVETLIEATDADNAADAISELHVLGIGIYWLGVVGEEESIRTTWPELNATIESEDEEGNVTLIPVFRNWGGVKV